MKEYKTLKEFLGSVGEIWYSVGSQQPIFIYNGCRCVGIVGETLNFKTGEVVMQSIEIRPVNITDKITHYAGGSIYITFPETSEKFYK